MVSRDMVFRGMVWGLGGMVWGLGGLRRSIRYGTTV